MYFPRWWVGWWLVGRCMVGGWLVRLKSALVEVDFMKTQGLFFGLQFCPQIFTQVWIEKQNEKPHDTKTINQITKLSQFLQTQID